MLDNHHVESMSRSKQGQSHQIMLLFKYHTYVVQGQFTVAARALILSAEVIGVSLFGLALLLRLSLCLCLCLCGMLLLNVLIPNQVLSIRMLFCCVKRNWLTAICAWNISSWSAVRFGRFGK